MGGMAATREDDNEPHHMTHLHAYELLLIGWIVGTMDDNMEVGTRAQEMSVMSPGP
jgi:hypothetical protein